MPTNPPKVVTKPIDYAALTSIGDGLLQRVFHYVMWYIGMGNNKWRLDFVNPRILETQEQVEEVNEQEKIEGGKVVWKLNDKCYRMKYTGYTKGVWYGGSDTSTDKADRLGGTRKKK